MIDDQDTIKAILLTIFGFICLFFIALSWKIDQIGELIKSAR